MIRQNRAVPILLVLTLTFVLYLAGCFGTEETTVVGTEEPTAVAPTPTPAPVVTQDVDPNSVAEEPFFHTVEQGDLIGTIASKYNVPLDVILRANPGLDPSVLLVGQQLRIPGASTDNTALENTGPDREDGTTINYVVQGGDSLGAIADEYLVSLEALLEANPDVDPATLQINQLLVVPPRGTGLSPEAIAARSTPQPQPRDPGEPQFHVVAAGDTISTIADLYSVTADEIIAANVIDDPSQIAIGQELIIPTPSLDG